MFPALTYNLRLIDSDSGKLLLLNCFIFGWEKMNGFLLTFHLNRWLSKLKFKLMLNLFSFWKTISDGHTMHFSQIKNQLYFVSQG